MTGTLIYITFHLNKYGFEQNKFMHVYKTDDLMHSASISKLHSTTDAPGNIRTKVHTSFVQMFYIVLWNIPINDHTSNSVDRIRSRFWITLSGQCEGW